MIWLILVSAERKEKTIFCVIWCVHNAYMMCSYAYMMCSCIWCVHIFKNWIQLHILQMYIIPCMCLKHLTIPFPSCFHYIWCHNQYINRSRCKTLQGGTSWTTLLLLPWHAKTQINEASHMLPLQAWYDLRIGTKLPTYPHPSVSMHAPRCQARV